MCMTEDVCFGAIKGSFQSLDDIQGAWALPGQTQLPVFGSLEPSKCSDCAPATPRAAFAADVYRGFLCFGRRWAGRKRTLPELYVEELFCPWSTGWDLSSPLAVCFLSGLFRLRDLLKSEEAISCLLTNLLTNPSNEPRGSSGTASTRHCN